MAQAPWKITRSYDVFDRESGVLLGDVHRTDYGWVGETVGGQRSPMHATRQQAAEAVWRAAGLGGRDGR